MRARFRCIERESAELELREVAMRIYPTVEITNGQCRRLKPGLFGSPVPGPSTAEQMAVYWMEQGAKNIHLVDIDGIKTGRIINTAAIKATAYALPVPLQLYGGIRSFKDIEFAMDCGIRRAVIGTKAMLSPGFVKESEKLFGAEKLIVSVHISDGRLVDGERERGGFETLLNYCMQMRRMKITRMIFHDVSPRGVMSGNSLELLAEISDITGIEVIISGKIMTLKELERINETGIFGVVLDDALYEGKIRLKDAVGMFQ